MRLLLQAFIFFTTIIILLGSCRSTKKIQSAITAKKDTVQVITTEDPKADSIRFMHEAFLTLQHNRIDFHTFSAKVKVDFEDKDGKKSDFNAFIRLRKDSILWVSINAALGIEAFRVVITPDSVKVLNKLDKIAQLRSVEYLQEIIQLPITFKELQDLIIGNPIYLDSNIVSYKKEEKTTSFINLGSFFKHLLTVDNEYFGLLNSKLDDQDVSRARTCLVTYGNYERQGRIRFSTFRKITVSEKNKLDIELNFKQFSFNEELSYIFNIPKNYKRQ